MNLRSKVFWILDALKGGVVKRHYDDVMSMLSHPVDDAVVSRRREYLRRILNHAKNTVPYYEKLCIGGGLNDFPIVNKNIIRNDINQFISSKFNKEGLVKGATSGSTGTPFQFYKDKNKVARNSADAMCFYDNEDYEIGKRLYYLRVWNKLNKQSPFVLYCKNMVMQDSSNLSSANIERFKDELRKEKCDKYMLGYASSFEAIYLNSLNEDLSDLRVKCIYSSSEVLTEFVRSNVSKLFGCPVYSRYSNLENGMLAQQYDMSTDEFRINTASYIIEILNFDNDDHVKDGERGRIVVTDLFNYGMPMLRYDTGDIGVYKEKSQLLGIPVIASVEGRAKDAIYNTKGERLTAMSINNTMARFSDILQYQFIQETETEYKVKINANVDKNREERITKELKKYLLDDAVIRFEYVNEIPLLNSGKRQYVVNKCPKYQTR